MTKIKSLTASAYIASIILGNIFVIMFGIGSLRLFNTFNPEQIYFTLTFPLGALWIGLTFSFRDFVQRYWGHKWCWLWMAIASVVTLVFNWKLALASMTAFVVAESVDWLAFYLLRHKTLKFRLIVSNIFSCPLDSVVFIVIAFGWMPEAVLGQTIIKYGFGLMALPLIPLLERLFSVTAKDKQNENSVSVV